MRKAMAFMCVVWFWAAGAVAQVVVIVHRDVPADTLSKAQLLDFYSCEIKYWNKDLPVIVIDLKPQTEAKTLFYKFLGMTASRMKSVWLKKMLLGEGEPPGATKTEDEMLEKVATTPGALGFVSREKLSPHVKTVMLIVEKQE